MQAKLEDILSGAVEIPASVQGITVKDKAETLYLCYNANGVADNLAALMDNPTSAIRIEFDRLWPASCEWVVEWEGEE